MVKFIKDCWFGILMSVLVFICLLFAVVIAVAPHNDAEMRGFAPCTYDMANQLGQAVKPDFKLLVSVMGQGYGCYLTVIKEGMTQYIAGKQPTPWANYLFQPVVLEADEEDSEPFPQDLLDANMLDEDAPSEATLFDDVQEKDDEK